MSGLSGPHPAPAPAGRSSESGAGQGSADSPRVDPLRLTEDLYDLSCFLVTAARQLPREARHYGPLRLATAAERIAEIVAVHGLRAPHLTSLGEALAAARARALEDPDGFLVALDEVILRSARWEVARLDDPPAGEAQRA